MAATTAEDSLLVTLLTFEGLFFGTGSGKRTPKGVITTLMAMMSKLKKAKTNAIPTISKTAACEKSSAEASKRTYSFIKRVFSSNQLPRLIPNITDFNGFCVLTKWFYQDVGFKVPYNKLFQYLNTSIKPS